MKKIHRLLLILFIFCNTKPSDSQNVVLIMADDLGIGDVSCYGATMIETPEIDKIARQGMRFDRFYTAGSVCTPTRYSILTGRYPIRRQEIASSNWDGNLLIETDRMTIGSMFKQMGYKTAAIGKWHLGYGMQGEPDYGGTLKPGPVELGFDYHWGLPRNHNDNIRGYVENHRLFGLDPNTPFKTAIGEDERVQGLLHERVDDKVNALLTERVLDFIRTNKDQPFFVYFTPTIAHTHITPYVSFRGSSKAGQYGDFVQELDFYVGEIMALLDELKLTGNTLLIFTSDNGGQLKDHWSAGIGLNLADESNDVRLKSKSAKTTAREMGHKTNLDLREGKASPYEGGFNVPLIIRWPEKIAAGTSSDRIVSSADFLATFGALFDVILPEDNGEDSFSFSDLLTGGKVSKPRTNVVLYSRPARSFVDGNWKLVDFSYSVREPREHYELYNLAEDPAESNDLAGDDPERLNLMRKKLKQISELGNSR